MTKSTGDACAMEAARKICEHTFNSVEFYKRVAELAPVISESYAPLVKERDALENDVRATLRIPFNPTAASVRYEHSMGQLGPNILRRSEARIQAPKTRLPVLVGTGSR